MTARFDAFISYSRGASARLATDLQVAVERFAKPWHKLRAVRIFRDDASMSANVGLWSTIERGLTEAEWLILLASPKAGESPWVAKEISWWLEHKSADRILIVLEEGADLVWDPGAGDFDWDRTPSLPAALRGAFTEEPRWIDLRWYEPDGSLGRADPRWQERVADIAAAIRFAERDELVGENVRELRRAKRLLQAGVAGLSLLLVASLVATALAVVQRKEANRQTVIAKTQARIAGGRQLATEAVLLGASDISLAALLAVQAWRTDDDAQSRAALFGLAAGSPELVRIVQVGAPVTATAVTGKGIVVTGDQSGAVRLWRGATPTGLMRLDGPVTSVAVSDDGGVVVAATADHGARMWTSSGTRDLDPGPVVAVSGNGRSIATSRSQDETTTLWSVDAGVAQRGPKVPAAGSSLAFGPRGLTLFSLSGSFVLVDPVSGRVLGRGLHGIGAAAYGIALSADGATFAGSSGSADFSAWRGRNAFADGSGPNAVASTNLIGGMGLALSADGHRLAASAQGEVQVVPVRAPGSTPGRPLRLTGVGQPARGTLAWGGNRFLVTGAGDGVYLWDLRQQNRLGSTVDADVPVGCEACGPATMTLSPDDALALMRSDGTAYVVADLDSGKSRELDPDGALDLSGATWLDDRSLMAWSATRQHLVRVPVDGSAARDGSPLALAKDESVFDLRVLPGHRAVVLTSTGRLLELDSATGRLIHEDGALVGVSDNQVLAHGIAPDGSSAYVRTYAAPREGDVELRLKVLDTRSDRVRFTSTRAEAADYDARSRLHVFDSRTAATLDPVTWKLRDAVPASLTELSRPVLDPLGRYAAASDLDTGELSLLDLAEGGVTLGSVTLPNQGRRYATSAFTHDGATLVTAVQPTSDVGGSPGTLRRLSLRPKDWVAAACALAGRNLTAAEWRRYGSGALPKDLRCVQ